MQLKRIAIAIIALTVAAFAQQQGVGGTGGVGGTAGIQTNAPPAFQITLTSLPAGTIGVAYNQTITTAFGVAPVTFSVISGALPNGLSLNASTGAITGTPGNNAGSYTFTIQAQDSTSPTPRFATQQYTISILCTPLQITSGTTLPAADQGVAFNFQVLTQGGIAPLSFSGANFPAGEGIASGTGIISGTPTVTGAFTPSVTVTDACPLTPQVVTQVFSQQVNSQLAITTTSPLPNATVGVPYTTQLARAGGTAPFSWSIPTGTLPVGLSLNATTGVVSGTPTNPQIATPTFQVTDALAATATLPASLTVACPALTISTTALPAGTQSQLYSFQMQPTGGFGALAWSATGLPAGLSISTSGLLSGTPSVNGSFTVTVSVADSCPAQQNASQTYTLSISSAIGPLTITSATTLPPVKVGTAYNQALQAIGGVPPYNWTVTNNTFPPGIVLNSSGTVSGIATTAGTYTPTVQVADTASATTNAVFTLVTSCPTITLVSTSPLPTGTQGQAYSFQFTATGGVLPLSWTLVGGTLPTGMTLAANGLLSGTPSSTGTFSPQVQVTDSCLATHSTASGTFTLAVAANSGALTITTNATLPAGTQGTPLSITLTAQGGTPPYTWSAPGAAHPGQVDLLDYALMPLPDRNSFHMTGATFKAFRLDGTVFWWLKGAGGNPWDMEVYDSTQLYHWGTENGDASQQAACQAAGFSSCFNDPFAYKLFVTPVPVAPRYFTLGGSDVVIKSASPNNYVRTTNCGTDAQPLINLGNIMGITHDAGVVAWGGSVGSVETIEIQYYWGIANETTVPPQSGTRERYELAHGFGQIQWDTSHWNGSGWTVDQTSTNLTKSAGGAPVPNFGCKVPNVPGTVLTTGVTKITSPQLDLIDSTGSFSGTPNKTGTFTFAAQVEDAVGATAFKTFSQTVTCAALSITTTSPLPGGTQNQPYSLQFTASGGAPSITWSATGLPAGMTMSSAGVLSGTPTAAAVSTIAVTATDSCNPTPQTAGPTNFSLTISAPAQALTIVTTNPLPSGIEGQAYNTQMAAQGGVPPYSWSKTAGSFQTGLSINTSGLISGTPTSASTQTPTLQVTDSAAATASGNFGITISCPALTITTGATLPPATQSVAYSFQMASSGGIAPVTWGASGLPTGLTISSTGVITGTPTVNGTFTVTITATDSCVPTPQAVPGTFTLQVNNNLAITTTSPLPSGLVNLAYSTTMSAAGGTPPYTWSITAGSLPTGLSLSSGGVISGTPTNAQTTTPTIKVTDNAAANISQVFSITINSQSGADNRYCTPTGTWLGSTTDGPANLPTKCFYTPLSATPSNGTVRGPDSTATALQNDINAAACGDVITVTAGSVIQGPIVLKPKGCSNSQWITIRSTGTTNGAFPAEGTRATPCIANVPSLPGRPAYSCANLGTNLSFQIFAPNAQAAITGPGADHYRIIGAELTRDQTAKKVITQVVDLSGTSPITNNIIFDRVWCHGVDSVNFPQTSTTDTSTTRCLYLGQSNHIAVIDSYISDFYNNSVVASTGNTDAQCMVGGIGGVPNTGWGVYKFVNNHCEGSGEGILLGGGGGPALTPPGCTILVNCNLDAPADLEIRRNYFFKPLAWNGNTATPGGAGWPVVKNGFEIKTGARGLFEGNVIENCWYNAQGCNTFSVAPVNQQSGATPPAPTCPTCGITDFTYRYNYGFNATNGIAIYAFTPTTCATCNSQGANRVSIHDNVVGDNMNTGSLTSASTGDALDTTTVADATNQGLNQLRSVVISHNTFVKALRAFLLWGDAVGTTKQYVNFTYQNNLTAYGSFSGWVAPGNPSGCATLNNTSLNNAINACATGVTWNFNAVFNWPSTITLGRNWPTNGSGAGNFFFNGFAGVGFTSYGNGNSLFNPSNYILLNTSPLHNAASDGRDVGANIPLVQSNIAGVRQ